ncbi:MAG: exo-alpha-sialidase [Hyphomicrobiales bacterium]|nr:exo-alpha-sialidase [Hyphomicrobiales bacterium]MDE2115296.1 exo-alpha-sialidase [Hyphomicrobiales bacterium]
MKTSLVLDGQMRPRADDPALLEAFIPSPCKQNHAANLMVLPGGDLGCVWFGGTQEGMSDISVYFSRLAQGTSVWSAPVKLSDDPTRSEQNPILFPTPEGELWLLYTSQRAGNQDTAIVRRRISTDSGRTWGPAEVLIDTPGTFVRQPLTVLPNGDWLLPSFLCRTLPGTKWSGDDDISVLKISRDRGRSWQDHVVPSSVGCVHMSIVATRGEELLALFRSRWADFIHESRSFDGGQTWSIPRPTTLPNNNSSIQASRLADGRIALIFNNSSARNASDRRLSLYDEIEDEDNSAPLLVAPAPGRKAFWGAPRAPITLAISADDGHSWAFMRDLELGDGFCMTNNSIDKQNRELSYPSILQNNSGDLDVAFTYHRQAIKHIRIASHWFDM